MHLHGIEPRTKTMNELLLNSSLHPDDSSTLKEPYKISFPVPEKARVVLGDHDFPTLNEITDVTLQASILMDISEGKGMFVFYLNLI